MNVTPLRPKISDCLDGFEHINRFWDRQHNRFVAKILPGEFYVTRGDEMIATTLGSCVSACIWDVRRGIGGMNHFMLPLTEKQSHEVSWGNEISDATRYGNYAMEHLINEILSHGGRRKNLRVKIFGGGKVIKQLSDIGKKNIEFVLEYIEIENLTLLSADTGETFPRKLVFDPIDGTAKVKKLRTIHNNTIVNREEEYQKDIIQQPVEGDIELF
ncbi:MAG: chemoreceptor glutamine deamidase CheD [Pseudomonadales bacterium]